MIAYFLSEKYGKKSQEKDLDKLGPKQVIKSIKEDKDKKMYDDFKVENNISVGDYVRKDNELNYSDYKDAKKNDKRTPLAMFWSFLKHKQIILFTFITKDRNSRILKYSLFACFIAFYLAFTALFFNDNIIRAIYTYKGNTDAAVHVTNVVLSSICSIIMAFIIRLVTLNDRDINKILSETETEKREDQIALTKNSLNIRATIFYAFSIIAVGICWYYVSAFCAVFKNSQGHYLINTLVAFIVCNLWPIVTSGITAGLRKLSLSKESSVLYKFSQIVSLF